MLLVVVLGVLGSNVGVTWEIAGDGETCTALCNGLSKSCSENHWPTGPDPLIAGCTKWVQGGFYEAPVWFEGNCAFKAPERLWNRGSWGLSGPRCDRVGHKAYRRICPCREEYKMAGVAAWGAKDTKWAIHERESNLLAGIFSVKVSSTIRTDTFHVSRLNPDANDRVRGPRPSSAPEADFNETVAPITVAPPTFAPTDIPAKTPAPRTPFPPTFAPTNIPASPSPVFLPPYKPVVHPDSINTVTQWYESGPDLTDDNSPHWHDYNTSISFTESNDLCTVTVATNGSMMAWCGNYTHLPYFRAITTKDLPDERLIFPGPSPAEIIVPLSVDFTTMYGGSITEVEEAVDPTEIRTIVSTRAAFALLTEGGRVVAWGDEASGGKAPELTDVVQLFSNRAAFAALLRNSSVVAWGNPVYGALSSPIHDVYTVVSTEGAFAALTKSWNIVTWGSEGFGGVIRGIHELEKDSRECPPTYTQPPALNDCKVAAEYLKLNPAVVQITEPSLPSGCWLNETEKVVYYNTNPVPVPCMWEKYDNASLRGEWFREEKTLEADQCKEMCCDDKKCSSVTHVYEFNNNVPSGTCRFYETEEMFTPTVSLTVSETITPTISLTASPKPSRTMTASPTSTASVTLTLPPTPTLTLSPSATFSVTVTPYSTPTLSNTSTLEPGPTPTPTTTPTIEVIYQHNVTYTSYVRVNEISLLCTSDPNSVANIVADKVSGIFATSKSFMAVSDRVAVWPHPRDAVSIPGVSAISPDMNSVFAAEDAFLVVKKNWEIETVWGTGGQGLFWTIGMPSLPPIQMGKILDIRTTTGAATVVSSEMKLESWKFKPDALGEFVSLGKVACYWTPQNEGLWTRYRSIGTALECAQKCLDTPGCTGFEYPTSGAYCAPWFDNECSNISSPGWHWMNWDTDTYELYHIKDNVLRVPVNPATEYYMVGKGKCTVNGTEPAVLLEIGPVAASVCEEACRSNLACKSYQTTATLRCKLFVQEANGATSAQGGNDTLCYSTKPVQEVPAYGFSMGSIVFYNDTGGAIRVNGKTLTVTPDGWKVPWEAVKDIGPTAYALVTSQDDPKYDVTRWKLEKFKTSANTTILIHSMEAYNYFIPSSRETLYGPFHIGPALSVPEDIYLRPLLARGDLWYHPVPNAGCPDIEKMNPDDTLSFEADADTVQLCGDVCWQIKSPSNCTSFSFSEAKKCRVYFHDECSYPIGRSGAGIGWVRDVGTTLYTMSVLQDDNFFDELDYGQDAPLNLTLVDMVRPSRDAFTAVLNGTVVTWGNQEYGGNTSYLQVGKSKYLDEGVDQIIPGVRSFSVRRIGAGHDECEITPCYAYKGDELKQPSSGKKEEAMDQLCFDPHPESWSPNDFLCVCTQVAHEAVGKPVECPDPAAPIMWPWLLLTLPLIGGICMRLDVVHFEKLEVYRKTVTLWDMYALHATETEENALEGMLAANPGSEIQLLRALVPHTEIRGGEARLFLLFQKRLSDDAEKKLPKDLIWYTQMYIYGPERMRAPFPRPMTPFGHILSQASTARGHLSPRRAPRTRSGGSDMWPSELITPLVDESSLSVTVL